MRRPGKAHEAVVSLSAPSRSEEPTFDGEPERVPGRVVRICSKCSRPLSVGERMFYFLEAVNTPCLCRICVLDQEREITSPSDPSKGASAPPSLDPPVAVRSPDPPTLPGAARRTVPLYFREREENRETYPRRSDSNGSLPSGARKLRLAASHYVDEGRLDEAIECIRELASELALSTSGGLPTTEGRAVRGATGARANEADRPVLRPPAPSHPAVPAARRPGSDRTEPTLPEKEPPLSEEMDSLERTS